MDGSSNVGCDSDEGVDLPFHYSKCLYEWIVFSGLFDLGGVRKFVMTVGEFHELYDIWWVGGNGVGYQWDYDVLRSLGSRGTYTHTQKN